LNATQVIQVVFDDSMIDQLATAIADRMTGDDDATGTVKDAA
jgi:hypothetical protein